MLLRNPGRKASGISRMVPHSHGPRTSVDLQILLNSAAFRAIERCPSSRFEEAHPSPVFPRPGLHRSSQVVAEVVSVEVAEAARPEVAEGAARPEVAAAEPVAVVEGAEPAVVAVAVTGRVVTWIL